MKKTQILVACGLISLSFVGELHAQFTSTITRHINISQGSSVMDSDHSMYLSDGTNLHFSDGIVTKTDASCQNILFSKTYTMDGSAFKPREAEDINGTIVCIEPRTTARVMGINLSGAPQWSKEYSIVYEKMCPSHNGNLILAAFMRENQLPIMELVEIDPYSGAVIQRKRSVIHGLKQTNSALFVRDIVRTSQGYFAAVNTNDMENRTISFDPSLDVIDVGEQYCLPFPFSLPNRSLDIRSLFHKGNGECYFSGEIKDSLTPNKDFICGKIDFNHNVVDNYIIQATEHPSWNPKLTISDNTARIVETPNKVPYYSGNTTIVPNNNAVTFCAKLSYNGLTSGRQRRVALFQFDEIFYNFNWAVEYEYQAEIASPGLFERPGRLVLFTDEFATNTAFENRLTEDFTGCNAKYLQTNEFSIYFFPIHHSAAAAEQELSVNNLDGNSGNRSVESQEICHDVTRAMLGISENNTAEVKVYPNPSNGTVYVDGCSEDTKITLYDATGRQVQKEVRMLEGKYELSGLETGVYLLKISQNQMESNHRFVVR